MDGSVGFGLETGMLCTEDAELLLVPLGPKVSGVIDLLLFPSGFARLALAVAVVVREALEVARESFGPEEAEVLERPLTVPCSIESFLAWEVPPKIFRVQEFMDAARCLSLAWPKLSILPVSSSVILGGWKRDWSKPFRRMLFGSTPSLRTVTRSSLLTVLSVRLVLRVPVPLPM